MSGYPAWLAWSKKTVFGRVQKLPNMGVVGKNLLQLVDRGRRVLSLVSGNRLPARTSETCRPLFVIGFGEIELRLLREALAQSHKLVLHEFSVPFPRLLKNLLKLDHRSWGYLCDQALEYAHFAATDKPTVRARLAAMPTAARSFAGLIDGVCRHGLEPDARWGACFEPDFFRLKRVREVFPDAQFVFLLRDGVDAVAAQASRQPDAEVAALAKDWTKVSVVARRLQEWNAASIHPVSYERLIADPATELSTLCQFLDLPAVDSMTDPILRARAGDKKSPYSIGYGRGVLSDEQMVQVVAPFANELTGRGYDDLPARIPHYYGQTGQDRYLAEHVFPGKHDGFFVDVGAHDGITFSNSLHFEKVGWRGVCIEPNPHVFQSLRQNRRCECINTCVSETNGVVEFNLINSAGMGDNIDMLSGIHAKYDKRHLKRVQKYVDDVGARVETIQVPSRRFADCIPAGTHVDFVSIDTEGAELSVLRSIDFSKVDIHCFVIENPFKNKEIAQLLHEKGYRLQANLEFDQVFVRDQPPGR